MNRNRKANIVIPVHDNVDRALRQLKKKIEREGVSRDMKRSVYFEPASQKKRKRLIRAVKQNLLRMATQGLIDISKHTLPS
jgi:small subunit ribosomal protein S21